jgi:PPOX class probable F420-dependent enzyme
MKEMTKQEVQNFLMAGTLTGKVATSRKDGVPHVVPIWFILDNDANIIFATGKQSAKGKHLIRDPRVCFSVDDQTPPFSFVMIEGTAEVDQQPDKGELLKWATRIAERYVGSKASEAHGKEIAALEGAMLVKIKPTKVIAQKDMMLH